MSPAHARTLLFIYVKYFARLAASTLNAFFVLSSYSLVHLKAKWYPRPVGVVENLILGFFFMVFCAMYKCVPF